MLSRLRLEHREVAIQSEHNFHHRKVVAALEPSSPGVTKLPPESMSFTVSGSVAASGEMMLLDAIATVILVGMMFIPLVNIIVGVVVGADLGGPPGALCGLLSALAISAAQKVIGDRTTWPAFGPATGREPTREF